MGPERTGEEGEECARRIAARPRSFIAQPVVALSVQPILDGGRLRRTHQDLRPFVLTGPEVYVTSGGLTRVALKAGSLVVNSSQGGGSRDTGGMAERETGSPGAYPGRAPPSAARPPPRTARPRRAHPGLLPRPV